MIRWLSRKRNGPIGIDLGDRAVKLVQLDADHDRLLAANHWDVNTKGLAPEEMRQRFLNGLMHAHEGQGFRGRDAVICLSERDLFLQNIRVPKTGDPRDYSRLVQQEAAGRLPYSVAEAEIRFLEADDVRQGDSVMREIILLACHLPKLEQLLELVVEAGFRPIGVDIEPLCVLRSYFKQLRRDDDHQGRVMFVHVGYSKTLILIAEADHLLFVKYVDLGGQQMDEAVARHLEIELSDASAIRRHNGDRRVDQQDPEVTRSVTDAIRPVVERLTNEIAMAIRYHSVTFRGRPLTRIILGGGEASLGLMNAFHQRIEMKCELGDPLRSFVTDQRIQRKGLWDVATGLALREMN